MFEAEKRLATARARLRNTRGMEPSAVIEFFSAKEGFQIAAKTVAEVAYREGYAAASAN